jgi:hypothetical protein
MLCRGLAQRLGDDGATAWLMRRNFPPGFSAPGPGELVTLVGNERVEDTAENLCRYQLYTWEHTVNRSNYGTLAECLDGAGDRDTAQRCYDAIAE